MNQTQEFLELVKQNPDLPIVPMVDSDVCCGDDYSWWLGSFGSARIDEYVSIEMYGECRFFTKDEQPEIEEYIFDKICDEWEGDELSDKEVEQKAHEQAEKLPWVKAIIVYIGLPEV